MSDEDFFRGLRNDIVDTTRKMMEEPTPSAGRMKKETMETASISAQKTTSVPASHDTVADDAVAKSAMEFVEMEIEKYLPPKTDKCVMKPDIDEADFEDEERPPSKPQEMVKNKKRKRKKAKQTESNLKDAEKKEAKQRETKPKEMRKEETRGGKSNETPDEDMEQLRDMIMTIEEQFNGIRQAYGHREAKPVMDPTQSYSNSGVVSTKDKGKTTIKERKSKSYRSKSESNSEESKRRDKKLERAGNEKKLPKNSSIDSCGNEELSAEKKLLVKLFMLNPSQRTMYIEKRGIELGVLDPHPFKKKVLVNKRVQQFSNTLFAEAKRYITPTQKNIEKNTDIGPVEKHATTKQKNTTFEQQVNYLLNNGEQCATVDVTLNNVRDETHKIMQDRLDCFVAGLVEKNIGYLVEGLVRINAQNHMQSFVDDPLGKINVFINSILLRRCAMDGDLVRVFVMNKPATIPSTSIAAEEEYNVDNAIVSTAESNGEQKTNSSAQNNSGFVVAILEKRHNRQCVGKFATVASGKKHYRTFTPRDTRIPPLRVFKQDWPNALIVKPAGQKKKDDGEPTKGTEPMDVTTVLYQAEIIEWQNDIPIGTILKSIGKCGVLEVENKSILVEHNLDVTPYGEDILAQLPSVPYSIPEMEMVRREDLRGECIFTIDPATARDLDDALSCKVLQNGNFLVGVHISDVTYFLRERSDLDELVKLRATSIYMVDAVYHMLPKQLCNTCSLLPGQDKLAFSVFWEILPNGTVLSTRFARSVINSCAQLSYEHAQIMLDCVKAVDLDESQFPEIMHGYTVSLLSMIVKQLQSIAVKLRQRRMDEGCLKFNQPKLTFRLDPSSGRPVDYAVYKLGSSNEMIEDFMLLANISVAEAIHAAFPSTSLLRSHQPPAENMMKNLGRTLASYGHSFSFASSKAIRDSMEAIVAGAEHPDAASSVLNVLLSKPMTRALYYCSAFASAPQQFKHYALSIPMYTHFTSPIRRYADCLVHRVLAAKLCIEKEPERTPNELQQLAEICNEKKYSAKLAGDASSMLYYRHWLAAVGQHETFGAVLAYNAHYIQMVLIHTGIVIKISTKKISTIASVVFEPTDTVGLLRLIPKDPSIAPVTLKIFSKVRVTIKVIHGAISVCSILPMTGETPPACEIHKSHAPAEQCVTDLSNEMRSACIN